MILAAHQPNFLPYLGFVDKMSKCDVFVIRDDVFFSKSDFHHRNKIRCNSHNNFQDPKFIWLTLNVEKKGKLKEIQIKKPDCVEKICEDIKKSYSGAKYFKNFYNNLENILFKKYNKLFDLNICIIHFIKNVFNLKCQIELASDLSLSNISKSKDLFEICSYFGADTYLSGDGAKNYLEIKEFEKIQVCFQKFKHPIYKQNFDGFIPNMSFIDFLFCHGI